MRRLISGRPLFNADREHSSQAAAARHDAPASCDCALRSFLALALLSLFLLWPSGSSLGLVLAVLGTGMWVGVQHLGYLEFGELARVAQRTSGSARFSSTILLFVEPRKT